MVMNMKVAVLFKDGFETIEALTVVDVMARAKIPCMMVGMDEMEVRSCQNITVKMDCLFDDLGDIDMVVLPGGLPGATNLQSDERVINLLKKMQEEDKYIAAICAGPISLETSGVVKDKKYTCYPGFEEQIVSGEYTNSLVEVDGKLITARGPAAALAFSYTLCSILGGDGQGIKEAMQYKFLEDSLK